MSCPLLGLLDFVTPSGTVGYSYLFTYPPAQLDRMLSRGRDLA